MFIVLYLFIYFLSITLKPLFFALNRDALNITAFNRVDAQRYGLYCNLFILDLHSKRMYPTETRFCA